MQVQDFAKNREETTANQRKVNKLISKLTNQCEELTRSEQRSIDAIEADFKHIEKALLAQKNKLKKDAKTKHNQQAKPLNDQKRGLEKENATINSKFEGIVRGVSLPPSNASLGAYGKIKNADFAQICGSTVKLAECSSSFAELKDKVKEASDGVTFLEYGFEATLDDLLESVKGHGEVKFQVS